MQGIMDFVPSYPKTRLQCRKLVGVDIYQPYLDYLEKKGVETIKHDLTKLPLPLPDKSSDHVLLLDILEHLEFDEALDLVAEAERIARKKIFVLTPKTFFSNESAVSNPYPYEGLGTNEYQRHKCLFTENWFKDNGFRLHKPPSRNQKKYYVASKKLCLDILHVWDMAGVAGCLAKYQRRLGHRADVVKRKGFDGLQIDDFYGTTKIDFLRPQKQIHPSIKKLLRPLATKLRALMFYLHIGKIAGKYDIVHVHGHVFVFPFILNKKKVLHLHGSEVRRHPNKGSKLKLWFRRTLTHLASWFGTVYVSTPDLTEEISNSKWIPNPVDTEHFTRKKGYDKKTGCYLWNWYDSPEEIEEVKDSLQLKLTVVDRVKHSNVVPYSEFPRFLERFEYFLDRHQIPSLSKTALEALALKMKVVDSQNQVIQGLPRQHQPLKAAEETIRIYREILK